MFTSLQRVMACTLALSLVGWTSSYPVAYEAPNDLAGILEPGDTVKVTTTDGRKIKTEVVEVTEDSIVGEDVTIPLADVADLQRVKLSKIKTGILAGVSVATVVTISLLIAIAASIGAALSNSQ